ncbi:uncharacterized protein [Dermacentor andersoni]|uniref:uncharacterized protein n=1 Tax=Dermacentor andersoni TaxID=34620 RepID=UPI002155F010|nr:uncharacterized protein LOC126532442 [Dermacentor andersoni]
MSTVQVQKSPRRRSLVEPESAEVYNATMGPCRESNAQLIDAFKNAFAPTLTGSTDASSNKQLAPRFIDVGCGDGNFTLNYLLPQCSSQCQELVGVDKSLTMLEYASLHHRHDKIRYLHLDIVGSDVDKFVNKHGLFARVYSVYVLHWITDRAQALRNIEKLMAPAAECFVLFENSIPLFEVLMALAESPRWKEYAKVLLEKVPGTARSTDITFLRSQLLSTLEKTNLKPLTCEVLQLPVLRVHNLEDATDRMVSYNPIYPLINDDEKKELCRSTADILAAREQGIAEGRAENYRFTYVIHAYKPTS